MSTTFRISRIFFILLLVSVTISTLLWGYDRSWDEAFDMSGDSKFLISLASANLSWMICVIMVSSLSMGGSIVVSRLLVMASEDLTILITPPISTVPKPFTSNTL